MGFFSHNYEREGPGVPEDGSRQNAFVRFFSIIGRKFWSMVTLNFMEFICSIPALAISAVFIAPLLLGKSDDSDMSVVTGLFVAFVLAALQLVTVGPLHAGFIYAMRNYAREENVFILSDFIKGIKQNLLPSTLVSLINAVCVFAVSIAYNFYNCNSEQIGSSAVFFKFALLFALLILAMMQLYMFPMMVTLNLNVKQLYGNAFRFAIGKFLPNLAILAIIAAFYFVIFINAIAGLAFMLIIGYSLPCFLSTFYSYGFIDKYIIAKIPKD